VASNFRSNGELEEYLTKTGVVGIAGIDTRALVRRIREQGAMKGVLSTLDLNDDSLVAKAQASPGLVGRDLVREVVPEAGREWNEPLSSWSKLAVPGESHAKPSRQPHVVALDYGMKWNIAGICAIWGVASPCCRARFRPPKSWPKSRMGCFYPMVLAIPSRWCMRSKRSASCWARPRYSASA